MGNGVEFRSLPMAELDFEIKAKKPGTDGKIRVEGYASTFDTEDSYRDIVHKGAFKTSIKERFKNKDLIRFLWQHNARLGAFGIPIEMGEDTKGLWTVAEVIETPTAINEWMPQIRQKGVQGLSIGFMVVDADIEYEDDNDWWGTRHIKEVELIEYSAVTFPANEESWIEGVKNRQLMRVRSAARAGGDNALAAALDVPVNTLGPDALGEFAERLALAYKAITGVDLPEPEPARASRLSGPAQRDRRSRPRKEAPVENREEQDLGEEDLGEEALTELRNFVSEVQREDDALAEMMAEIRSRD